MKALEYFTENFQYFVDEIRTLIAFKSISTDPAYKKDVEGAANWVKEKFESLGFEVTVIPTSSNPVVIARYTADPSLKRVLLYGHYDVQPIVPLDEWESDPFVLTHRGDKFYGRGIMDNKGQFMMHVAAIESMIKTEGKLPLNVTFLVEGDEETGSADLEKVIRDNTKLLAADLSVISDGELSGDDIPVIEVSFRGVINFELHVYGPKEAVHSGSYGGSIANPAFELAKVLASFYDEDYRITVPHFYDKVSEMTKEEKEISKKQETHDAEFLSIVGSKSFVGEKGFSRAERIGLRPTIQITGVESGYTGVGFRNIVPSKAMAKFNCRLVTDQDPKEIYELIKKHIADTISPDVTYELTPIEEVDMVPAVKIDVTNAYMKEITDLLEDVYGNEVEHNFVGGTLPITVAIKDHLKIPTILVPLIQQDSGMHSPNERLLVDAFTRGVTFSIAFLSSFKKSS